MLMLEASGFWTAGNNLWILVSGRRVLLYCVFILLTGHSISALYFYQCTTGIVSPKYTGTDVLAKFLHALKSVKNTYKVRSIKDTLYPHVSHLKSTFCYIWFNNEL